MKKLFILLMVVVLVFAGNAYVFAEEPEIEAEEHVTGNGRIKGHIEGDSAALYPGTDGYVEIDYDAGIWLKNYWVWYMDEVPEYDVFKTSFDADPLIDFITLVDNAPYGMGEYRLENCIKLVAIDNADMDELMAAGHVIVQWPPFIPDNYMMFVQNIIKIYNSEDMLVAEYNMLDVKTNPGLRSKKYNR